MSFFSFGPKFSKVEHPITELEVKRLVSHENAMTLDAKNCLAIEAAIISRRQSDGKISLQQIWDTLTHLKNQNVISKQDRTSAMELFKKFYSAHFQN